MSTEDLKNENIMEEMASNVEVETMQKTEISSSMPAPAMVPSEKKIEAMEEAKLKAKYPNIGRPMAGSAFLQKRISKGQKYFDSGDYQMAKQRPQLMGKNKLPPLICQSTGDAIPTPESVPVRKTSIIQHSKLTAL